MENRFLEMNDYLGQVAKTRGPTMLRRRRAAACPPMPAALSVHQSLFATSLAAADRVLVILIHNGGIDLGVPELVDKLLSSVPGSSSLPDSTRQQLVELIRDKIKTLTDSLIESAELSVNRYAGSKPEFFGDVVVLRDGTASYAELKQTLVSQSRQGKIIDLLILTHGGQDSISATGDISGQKIKDIRTELGAPLNIRSVYMMNCIGSSLNQAWIDAGARVSSGAIRNNYLPEPTTFFYWQNWKAGKPFEESVTSAYRKTINVMNEAVRGFVRGLPIPGSGALAEAIDFESMEFVRDSAPVIQGQRSLTINSDDLSVAQSIASSLATTVLHVGLLQSLRAQAFEAVAGGPRTRPLSPAGLEFLKRWEGFRPRLCNENGHCTVGYGSVMHAGPCDGRPIEEPYAGGISDSAAVQLVSQQAGDVRALIDESLTVPLTQNQSDALISLAYDIGVDTFKGSTLVQKINAGDNAGAAAEIRKWTKEQRPDGGRADVPVLVKRRDAEAELFLKPDPVTAQLSLGGRFAGAFAGVSFSIPGVMPVIAQPSGMTCWAAVVTMMWSWRNNQSRSIRDTLAAIGPKYVAMFDSGTGLDGQTARALYSDAGLEVLEGFNSTIEGWESFLKKYGPLYVDVGLANSNNTHALIVTGISGDGTAAGTNITYVNPAGGRTETVTFAAFNAKYELPAAVEWPFPIVHWPAGNAISAQNSLFSHTYSEGPRVVARAHSRLSVMQNPVAAVIAGIEIADAAQIGLAAVSIVQAQASASQGSFALNYDKAQRLLTQDARRALPPIAKSNYSQRLFYIGSARLNAASADIVIEWAGNAYGEIETPIISRNLDTSTEWSKSSASIVITRIESIPDATKDPREWPIVYRYEGTYDPYGNGYFEFNGRFEINAFGGLTFVPPHKVVSRATVEWAVMGAPEQYVQKGADSVVATPPIPEKQLQYLREHPAT